MWVGGGAGIVAERADGVPQRRGQLGVRPIELGEELRDAADSEGGVDAVKPCLGCVRVVVRNADCSSAPATIPSIRPLRGLLCRLCVKCWKIHRGYRYLPLWKYHVCNVLSIRRPGYNCTV